MAVLSPEQQAALHRVQARLPHISVRERTHIAEDDLYDICRSAVQEARASLPSAARPGHAYAQPTPATTGTVLAAAIVQTYLAHGWSWTTGRKQWSGRRWLGAWRRGRLLSLAAVAHSVATMMGDVYQPSAEAS